MCFDSVSYGYRKCRLVDKYILQRTKDDVFEDELLGKDDVRVFCELTPLQVFEKCIFVVFVLS